MVKLRAFALLIIAFAMVLSGCTRKPSPPDQDPKLTEVFLELEQQHKRQMSVDGFSMDYSLVGKNQIQVTVRYVPNSPEAPKAIDVGQKAVGYAKSLATEKYGLSGVDVQLVQVPVEASKDARSDPQ